MNNAIEWMKSNPLSVVSIAVGGIGLLVILYFFLFAASAFSEEKSLILEEKSKAQEQLFQARVPIPTADTNAEPEDRNVVVNQAVIDVISQVYGKIANQFEQIIKLAEEKNLKNHIALGDAERDRFLLGRGKIWPNVSEGNFTVKEGAKDDYLKHFKALFTPQDEGFNMPSMRVGSPPPTSLIEAEVKQAAKEFATSRGLTATERTAEVKVKDEDAQGMFQAQRYALMKTLTGRAKQINMYVKLPEEQDRLLAKDVARGKFLSDKQSSTGATSTTFSPGTSGSLGSGAREGITEGYPFSIAPWASRGRPKNDELWEAQVDLWVIRDIMWAIHKMNKVDSVQITRQNEATGEAIEITPNVMESPIKRLITLHPLPGYVGLHTYGAAMLNFDSNSRRGGTTYTLHTTTGGSSRTTTRADEQGSTVYRPVEKALAPGELTERAREDFGITPTGHVSNAVHDVRHTRLVIDIERSQIPQFINKLQDENYMTVLLFSIEDVDEYEMMRKGYVYGTKDVVKLDMTIESLWFRSWTVPLMPSVVKQNLLIDKPEKK